MLQSMRHRGPHGSATAHCGRLIMAANRLAIRGIDQVQPPLIEHAAGIVVACNGEIDNHRELRDWLAARGHEIALTTDVAVIAPLYLELGVAFLEKLQGVFALALWDPRTQQLLLARDRAGERHLYYAQVHGTTYFASELAALATVKRIPKVIDTAAMASFVRSGYCPSPASLLADCRKLRPGEMITVHSGQIQHTRYWQIPSPTSASGGPSSAPTTQSFDAIFRAAVYRQSEVDVDFGVLLSGGLDSALITAVALSIRPGQPLSAYCVRFAEASYDESDAAAGIAARLQCHFKPVTIGASDFPTLLRTLVRTTGEPLADPAWIPLAHLTGQVSQRVLLGGEGADELFAGYPTYPGARLAQRYAALPRAVRRSLGYLIERLPSSDKKVTVSFLLKRFMRGQGLNSLARHVLWSASVTPAWLLRLGLQPPPDPIMEQGRDLLDALQQYDFSQPLAEGLLAKADRGAMLHGVEVRAPFLDPAVIAFARTLSPRQRVRGLQTKVFLKRYAEGYLPASLVHQRKRGLSVPLAAWLRGPLHDWAHALLSSDALTHAGVRVETALEMFDEHQSHVADHARGIWTLIVLSEWLEWLAQVNRIDQSSDVFADGATAAAVRARQKPVISTEDCAGIPTGSPLRPQ